jgi:hypothetical protein
MYNFGNTQNMNTSNLASNWNTVHKHRIHKQLLTITQPNWREIKLGIEHYVTKIQFPLLLCILT